GTVSFAVNRERTRTANSFAAIGIECDWLLAAHDQLFIQNIEHFQKRRVRRDVFHVVIHEFAGGFWIRLPPNAQAKVHSCEQYGTERRAVRQIRWRARRSPPTTRIVHL